VVLVGPVVKVNPAHLPRAANIHYLGPRPYETLPSYLAGFDVCLMPFALNDASRFINPTKTLEYLASGRPVVSSPIPEVVRRFSKVVYAAGGERFSRGVGQILSGKRRLPVRKGLELARRHSWTTTVNRMELLLRDAIARREAREKTAARGAHPVRLLAGTGEAAASQRAS
jgi:UDP-galactopyranose mutase